MQSITKFFSPKKNDKESDFQAAKSDRKANKTSKSSLLKIVDNEVEDITGLLFGTLNEELNENNGTDRAGISEESSKEFTENSVSRSDENVQAAEKNKMPDNDASPVANRSRRFSFNIKSPVRTPQKKTTSLSRSKKDYLDCSFDEALSITVNNPWSNPKEDVDVEVTHPKKRLKTDPSTSDAESIGSPAV